MAAKRSKPLQVPSETGLKSVWKELFSVMSYDIDFNSRLKFSNLCGFFQEIAGRHAEHLGVGYHSMLGSGRVWMLSRLYIKIHAYPEWQDDLTIETWPSGMERLFFRRDFRVFRNRQKMISAVSYWLALDIKSLRPLVFNIEDDVIRRNAGRFALEGLMDRIPALPEGDTGKGVSRQIRYSELDQNRHANNTRYVEWILDQFETSFLERSIPHFLAIEYKHEVKEHDVLNIRHAPDPQDANTILVEGLLEGSKQVCFKAKVMF